MAEKPSASLHEHPQVERVKAVSSKSSSDEKPMHTLSMEAGDHPTQRLSLRLALILFFLLGAYFAILFFVVGSGFLAQSIVAVVGGRDKFTWITLVIGFTGTTLGPVSAQLADYWGRRWLLAGGMVAGGVGCVILSRSNSFAMAIVGMVIASFTQVSLGLIHTVISEILPRKYRPMAQGMIHGSGSLSAAAALYTAGALCQNSPTGFRTFFYIATALFFAAALGIAIFYTPPARELQHLNTKEKFNRLDFVSYALLIVGLFSFCIGLSWSQNPYGWNNAHVLVPFLVGIAGIVGLVVYGSRINKEGLIHHELFKGGPNFAVSLVCTSCEGLIFFAPLNYFGFELAVLFNMNLLKIGYIFSISWWTYGVTAMLAGLYCSRARSVRLPTVVAFASGLIYFVLMATAGSAPTANFWGYYGGSCRVLAHYSRRACGGSSARRFRVITAPPPTPQNLIITYHRLEDS